MQMQTLTAKLTDKSTIMVNGYMSNDESNLNTDTTYAYQNRNVSASWTNEFSDKLFGNLLQHFDHYEYGNKSTSDPLYAYELTFESIKQISPTLRTNSAKRTLNSGQARFTIRSIAERTIPSATSPVVLPDQVEPEHGLESAIFLEDEFPNHR